MIDPPGAVPRDDAAEQMLPHQTNEYITSVAHYYRGEMSRMITWRDRLDHTTNWAIAASAAMLSVTLSSAGSHHAVILCCVVIVLLLLHIESRRYRFFDVSRRRVRLIEQNYFSRVFSGEVHETKQDWRGQLSTDLQCPQFQLTLWQAMSVRLRRNYLWIFLTLLTSWWLKVTTVVLDAQHGQARFVGSLGQLLENARVSYIPGAAVIAGVVLFFFWVVIMSFGHGESACGDDRHEADV